MVTAYSPERLGSLLRLLRPAPTSWVVKAQRTLQDRLVGESLLTEADLAELRLALETDAHFSRQFDADPIAAARDAGKLRLALGLEREVQGLVALAERVAADGVYRVELETDPTKALAEAGIPVATHEPLLRALDASDDALARLPEVVAHQHEQPVRVGIVLLLLGTSALAGELRAAADAG